MAKNSNKKEYCGCAFWIVPLAIPLFYYLFGTWGVDVLAVIMFSLCLYGIYSEAKETNELARQQCLKNIKEEEINFEYKLKFLEDCEKYIKHG